MDPSEKPSPRPAPVTPRGSLKPALLSFIAFWVVRLIGWSLRFRIEDAVPGRIRVETDQVFLFAVWHNRIGIMPSAYQHYLRRKRLAALVSASRDGEILARTLGRFGFQPVRGSTSRRGPQSLLEMVRWSQEGFDAVITPDGPRGPAEVVQEGIINLAKVTGLPITPVSCIVSRCVRLHSWDRFMVPLPFARCLVRVGRPLSVPRDAAEETLERLRLELQESLKQLSQP